jgi:hypothetical protein
MLATTTRDQVLLCVRRAHSLVDSLGEDKLSTLENSDVVAVETALVLSDRGNHFERDEPTGLRVVPPVLTLSQTFAAPVITHLDTSTEEGVEEGGPSSTVPSRPVLHFARRPARIAASSRAAWSLPPKTP